MRFLLPQGIGDSVWALLKIQDIANKLGDGIVDVFLNTMNADYRENRAIPFIKKFKFVNSVSQVKTPITKDIYPPLENGYYTYLDDGLPPPHLASVVDYVLIPNRVLERGQRIETWLPEFSVNWNIMDDFQFTEEEEKLASDVRKDFEYCVFYLGPKTGNTIDGHNRNALWKPQDWAELGKFVTEKLKLKVIVVGAGYDFDYWTESVRPFTKGQEWLDFVGSLEIGSTYAVAKKARFVISYQSGIGIVSEYMGVPSALFWRQRGNSISPYPNFYTSFEEAMNGAWSPPHMLESGKHMALYYGRHDAKYVCDELLRRGW